MTTKSPTPRDLAEGSLALAQLALRDCRETGARDALIHVKDALEALKADRAARGVAVTDDALWRMAYVAYHGFNGDGECRDLETAKRQFGAEAVAAQIAKMRVALSVGHIPAPSPEGECERLRAVVDAARALDDDTALQSVAGWYDSLKHLRDALTRLDQQAQERAGNG